ncbi:MAG: beta-lactamase family protein [Bacillus sp. (in: Bacteria)]|nr:beta-lactamase family protein [Bacillus sp. (in: firmicutes)]MCM1427722.1 beta-lactamase family protein [Eubacterium sp.]
MLTFEKTTPEASGIPGGCIVNMIERLQKRQIPMHSLLLMRHDKLFFEGYYAPCTADTLHRMFSISKSLTSIAIGLLAEEGKLSLDDPIIKHFPEKLPEKVHPWIASMTIQDMLMMRSCHASTTYKLDMTTDWVKSYFTTPPTHPAGTLFHYDTSAPHTLCALVEKMTGMDMLDYLKKKLAPLELSKQSYMIKDPFGVSMGGSGLVSYPMDLLKFGYFLLHRGNVCGKQLISASYIDKAVSKLSETCMTAPLPSEAQGYGMQFWRGEKNNYICYGMGGQFIIVFPDYDLICVTTADTQSIGGGNQQIYDALYEELLPYIQDKPLPEHPDSVKLLSKTLSTLAIEPVAGETTNSAAADGALVDIHKINGKTFRVRTENTGFESFTVQFDNMDKAAGDAVHGSLSFVYQHQSYTVTFGMGNMQTGSFPIYNLQYAASGAWLSDGTFYIKAHIIDAYVGCVQFQLSFHENSLTVFMRKKEESLFHEFDGHCYCICDE